MRRAAEARLDRLEGRLEARLELPFEVKARNRRRQLRWMAKTCAMIRETAEAAGIDPAEIGVLRLGERAAATLRGFADSPRRVLADEEAGKADDQAWIACHPIRLRRWRRRSSVWRSAMPTAAHPDRTQRSRNGSPGLCCGNQR